MTYKFQLKQGGKRMGMQSSFKKFFVFVLVLVLGVFGSSAFAGVLKAGDDKHSIEVYGQVNRAVLYADDGDEGELYNVDNDFSSTRIGLKAKYNPESNITIGANLEFEYQINPSGKVWQGDKNYDDDAEKFLKRIIEVYVKGSLGTLSLGHGSTASDNTTELDLSGTAVVSQSKVHSMAGGIRFFDKNAGALSTAKIADVFNNLDGFHRQDRIRYDSPSFYGVTLSASVTNDDDDSIGDDGTVTDGALSYKGSIGDMKVLGAVAYVDYGSTSYYKNLICGSVSMLLKNGLNTTFAAGIREKEDSALNDATYYYGKVGYIANIFSVGPTAFAVDYGVYKDIRRTSNDDEADTLGFFIVQNITKWNTEFYFGYRNYSLDREGMDVDDINAGMIGIRVKF
jgi:hypothetical protein